MEVSEINSQEPVQEPVKKSNLDSLYEAYTLNPTPDNLRPIVAELEPSINYHVSAIGAGDDKLVRQKARVIAGEAVKTYDPTKGSNLKTWVNNQMVRVKRFKRDVQQPVKIPERMQLDAYTLYKAEQAFMDQHDREPDLQELADFAAMPIKRIQKIRRAQRIMPSETTVSELGGSQHTSPDLADEALDYIYSESDKIDRQIIEMKTGYGGKYNPLQPKEIATKLKLTPSQLSRRSARLAYKLQQYESALEKVI